MSIALACRRPSRPPMTHHGSSRITPRRHEAAVPLEAAEILCQVHKIPGFFSCITVVLETMDPREFIGLFEELRRNPVQEWAIRRWAPDGAALRLAAGPPTQPVAAGSTPWSCRPVYA
jgi:hypothetical protein